MGDRRGVSPAGRGLKWFPSCAAGGVLWRFCTVWLIGFLRRQPLLVRTTVQRCREVSSSSVDVPPHSWALVGMYAHTRTVPFRTPSALTHWALKVARRQPTKQYEARGSV